MLRLPGFLLVLFSVFACSSGKIPAPASAPPKASLTALKTAMTGSFSSAAQASSNDNYYNIVLHMQPIWPAASGDYLYVEQAMAAEADRPYRQRVYKLEQKGRKKFVSRVFEIPEPERFVGAYRNPALLDTISPDDLVERAGCAVYLKMTEPGMYRGETKKNKCKSALRGATYATSRVSVAGSFLQSWDRGFDDAGKQVWGATEGGYMFFRQ